MSVLRRYFEGLAAHVGERWNRFWYEPSDPFDLCVLRIVVGAWALAWQLSYSQDLDRWLGSPGWFDAGMLDNWLAPELSDGGFSGRLSFLYTAASSTLWTLHVISAVVLAAFTLGLLTRASSVLALIIVLAYIHRAPFVCGAPEVVLVMLIGYLCIAPCGDALSLDARWRPRPRTTSAWATIARRLLQVHLVAIYAIMALAKLGAPTWWNGEAVWWLAAQPLSRDVDLTALRQWPLLLNVWTYAILITEFSFVVLVWNLWFRPLVLAAATVSWLSIGVASGNFVLPLTMILAHFAFIPSWFWTQHIPLSRSAVAAPN